MAQEYGISVGAVIRAVDVIRAEGLARTVPAAPLDPLRIGFS
jgi:hypothetical protein